MIDEEDRISIEEADARIAERRGVSVGAAENLRIKAVASGNVRAEDYNTVFKRWVPIRLDLGIWGLGNTGRALSRSDLEHEIERQFGAPPASLPKKNFRGAGRRQDSYWEDGHRFIKEWLEENGALNEPGDKARLEKHTADYLAKKYDVHPVKSTIQEHIKKVVAIWRKAGN